VRADRKIASGSQWRARRQRGIALVCEEAGFCNARAARSTSGAGVAISYGKDANG
jgi:hypothetical protein